jgi:cell division protein FtsZ
VIELDPKHNGKVKIRVVGVGGGGGNAINRMIELGVHGVDFIAINTDLQALECNRAENKIQAGKNLLHGLGTGGDVVKGQQSVEECRDEITRHLTGSDLVFVTAGLGGGMGTGGTVAVANIAKLCNAVVIGIVTKPFNCEGKKRSSLADEYLISLRKNVDALITIPNQKLFSIIEKNTPLQDAFNKVNEILYYAVNGIIDVITASGFTNVDFSDIKTVIQSGGDALFGIGTSSSDNRAAEAARAAISSPMSESNSLAGSKGVLINVKGGKDMSLFEYEEAVRIISDAAGDDAIIIPGVVIDEKFVNKISVTVIATINQKKTVGTVQTLKDLVVIDDNYSTLSEQSPDYEVPAVLRKKISDEHFSSQSSNTEQKYKNINNSDFEKPAFLRKIMD